MKNRKLALHVLTLSFFIISCKPVPTTADDIVSEDNNTISFEWVSYTVQQGDSLAGIAVKFDISTETVMVCNNLHDVRELRTGMELRLPTIDGAAHTVDTTKKIPAKAKEFYDIGLTYADGGEFTEAITYYSQALRIQADYVKALFQRGYAYGQTSRYNKAIADYNKVLEIIPYQTGALINRGTMYAYKKNYDKAIADYTEALRNNPYLASAFYGRGLCFLDNYLAVVHTRSLRLLYNYLTNAYARKKGNLDLAIADFTEALLIKPDYMDALYWRSVAYRENGEFAKAAEDRELINSAYRCEEKKQNGGKL